MAAGSSSLLDHVRASAQQSSRNPVKIVVIHEPDWTGFGGLVVELGDKVWQRG